MSVPAVYMIPAPASILHRLGTGFKLIALFFFSIFLFLAGSLPVIFVTLAAVAGFYKTAGLKLQHIQQQIQPICWLLVVLLVFQYFYTGWQNALVVTGRLVSLFLLAGLIMLTTQMSQIMAAFERAFRFLQPLGFNPARISLVLSLTLRFIPVLSRIMQEVREAQKARGLEGNLIATTVPVIIRTIKMSEDIAAAIEARCYDES